MSPVIIDRNGLALEPLFQIGIAGDMLGQDLDGDGTIQAGVGGFVDLAHAALADEGGDFVRANDLAP